VIVGGTVEGHGIVTTASYEARSSGCGGAIAMARAVKLCPGRLPRPRGDRYVAVSREVFRVLEESRPSWSRSDRRGPSSTSTGCGRLTGSPAEAGRAIKAGPRATGGLTASAGIASSKFVAKVASDLRKPDPGGGPARGRGRSSAAPFPVEKIWGVGPKTADVLHARGFRRMPTSRHSRRGSSRLPGERSAAAHLRAPGPRASTRAPSSRGGRAP